MVEEEKLRNVRTAIDVIYQNYIQTMKCGLFKLRPKF